MARRAMLYAQQMEEVKRGLESLRMQQKVEEDKLRENWKLRDMKIWERIEGVIKFEEDKVRALLEAERKAKEAAEQKQKEEELQRRLLEEKQKEEEEEKRKEQEEESRLEAETKMRELEEEQLRLEQEMIKLERLESEREQRQKLGLTTADDDWYLARSYLAVSANLH